MRGQYAISTLIIFIAMIITAAIAAGVIIYTTQQLQQKALLAGSQAQGRVTNGLEVNEVLLYQYNYSSGVLNNGLQAVSGIGIITRLGPAASPINLGAISSVLTDGKGDVYSYAATTPYPSALIGYEEGNDIIIEGLLYDDKVVSSVNISDSSVCKQLNNGNNVTEQYISVKDYYNNKTLEYCIVSLNSSIIGTPISINTLFQIMEEMNSIGVQAPFSILNLVQNNVNGLSSVYLTNGEITELLYYLPKYIYPQETFELQVIPYNGYQFTIQEAVPSVLQYSVEVVQA